MWRGCNNRPQFQHKTARPQLRAARLNGTVTSRRPGSGRTGKMGNAVHAGAGVPGSKRD